MAMWAALTILFLLAVTLDQSTVQIASPGQMCYLLAMINVMWGNHSSVASSFKVSLEASPRSRRRPPPPVTPHTAYKPVCTWPQERENEGGCQLTADPHSTAAFTVLMTTAGCVVIGMLRRHLSVSVSREKPKNNSEAPPMGGHHTTIRGGEWEFSWGEDDLKGFLSCTEHILVSFKAENLLSHQILTSQVSLLSLSVS